MSEDVLIRIPASMARDLELRLRGSKYRSLEEYVLSVITEVTGEPRVYSEQDEKAIKARLTSLGYD